MTKLSENDRRIMKRHFHAAKGWDKLRRKLIQREPNDPVQNRIICNRLFEMARRVHRGVFVDGPKEDESEIRLARVLSRR